MKFKPIVWSIDEGRTRGCAQRLGHNLTVLQTDGGFEWQLYIGAYVGGSIVEYGESSTFDEALAACDDAWERYVGSTLEDGVVKPLSWNEQNTAYGADNMGFTIKEGRECYIVVVEPEQTIAKHHFGFKTLEEAKVWCERYNKETVEEADRWLT